MFFFIQGVYSDYHGWSKDSDSVDVCFGTTSTCIQLDIQQEVDSWKIVPLARPSKVVY